MKIAIGSDHAGFHYKEMLRKALQTQGYDVKDFGALSDESSDYADFAHPVSNSVETAESAYGVLVCGSANGREISRQPDCSSR